ncbi:DEAD/DEAH box helicase [Ruania halotolerans]|uniref:DEAD/DEAH box helicase n=1 Tax=Ruania halotolerans TaxID=2897773 RepID=UPI001E4B0B93|nr:DEAD/DEAH box helicase [Ruania halotolerans]UFU08275.1 DEAD/DEAH box helicase [Ruania halotolerans]
MSSPAERYTAFRRRQTEEDTPLSRFRRRQDFALDDFQEQGCRAVQDGHGVLVAAPTGAGKTIVGEFAVALALEQGRKAFYTTPIKALSNQKFQDLRRVHGADAVGLLTGDTTINGDASVVVMTTEVLRNMLYNDAPALRGLGFVVMDEVHYLADRFRGPVWEEVILHLARDVQVVSLSATVSNAEEFGQWLTEVRGDTSVVVSERRPVPLWQHMMVGRDLLDLYGSDVDPTDPGINPPISPDLVEAIRAAERSGPSRGSGGRGGRRNGRGRSRYGNARQQQVRVPPRFLVVDQLDRAGLLPAIVFIFSRAGCEAAVQQVARSGIALTSPAERAQIDAEVERRCANLPPEDLHVLDFWAWREALLAGVAAHHAGLLPVFKETVEALFAAGLVKVVFATETLALGINMPARSVVLEKLTKWDGRGHAEVTSGEYTQLTGRAGRRGIDVEGHAVVLYASGVDPVAVAGLASRRTYPLRSSFTPTYNMAVNLIATTGWSRARETLETSFAQFQADRSVVGLARKARSMSEALDGYTEAMTCHLGDIEEYLQIRDAISHRERELSRSRSRSAREATDHLLAGLRRGDVVQIPSGRRAGFAVVLENPTPAGLDGPPLSLLTAEPRLVRMPPADLPYGTEAVTRVRIPKHFNARRPAERRDLASTMRNALGAQADDAPSRAKPPSAAATDGTLVELREALRHHACHGCADREEHARWAKRRSTLESEHRDLLRRIEGRTASIARDFDKVCRVLASLGYLEGDGDDARVTEQGQWLRRLYCEKDLVLAECLRSGAWADLDAAGLAAVASVVLYQSRGDDPAVPPTPPGPPDGTLAVAVRETTRTSHRLEQLEREHRLSGADPVDLGLVRPMYAWARGGSLSAVLDAGDLAAGDFVRWTRQVLDLLDHVAIAAPTPRLRDTAREAIAAVRRGIVAHGTI